MGQSRDLRGVEADTFQFAKASLRLVALFRAQSAPRTALTPRETKSAKAGCF